MSMSYKKKNPFEVLGLLDGEMSAPIIESAYKSMRKALDEQLSNGNKANHITYEELEKAFQELIGYLEEDLLEDPEEIVISASFLPRHHQGVELPEKTNVNNVLYMYKESAKQSKVHEMNHRPIDKLMDMKLEPKRVRAHGAEKQDTVQSLEKIIAGTEEISGSLLKKLREKMSVSFEEMSSKIKVSKYYLEAIENDLFENLPAEIYTKGFFNAYLSYIGLDRKDLIEALMEVYRAKKRLIKKK